LLIDVAVLLYSGALAVVYLARMRVWRRFASSAA
jgi:hypothetical protein